MVCNICLHMDDIYDQFITILLHEKIDNKSWLCIFFAFFYVLHLIFLCFSNISHNTTVSANLYLLVYFKNIFHVNFCLLCCCYIIWLQLYSYTFFYYDFYSCCIYMWYMFVFIRTLLLLTIRYVTCFISAMFQVCNT